MTAFDDLPLSEKLVRLEQVAQAALPHYGIGRDAGVRMINLSENATYRIEASDSRRFALRVHREGYHSRNAIASELAWVQALRRDGAAITPIPLSGRDGELIQTMTVPAM